MAFKKRDAYASVARDVFAAKAAEVAHEANRAYCRTIGDDSQSAWADAPDWQRQSAIAGVKALLDDPDRLPSEMHDLWLQDKARDGWVYGPVKDAVAKTHPCCVPYDKLPREQKIKDALFSGVVLALIGLE